MRSPRAISDLLENARQLRGLAWRKPVSAAKHLAFFDSITHFCDPVSGRDFQYPVFVRETRFERTETGLVTCHSGRADKAIETLLVSAAIGDHIDQFEAKTANDSCRG